MAWIRSLARKQAPVSLPLGDGTILMNHASHGTRAAKWDFLERVLGQFEAEARFVRQWKSPVHHPHRREAKPFFPDLVSWLGLGRAADFLHDEVGPGGVNRQHIHHTDRSLAATCP